MLLLAQTETVIIFHGNQFLRGYVRNVEKLFFEENEINHIQKALQNIDRETLALTSKVA
jgi:hypothetical protein